MEWAGWQARTRRNTDECAVRRFTRNQGCWRGTHSSRVFLTFPSFDDFEDWYVFVYLVTDFVGELIDSPEGDLRWVNNSELSSLYLWEGDAIFLSWLDHKGIFSAKFTYKNGRLLSHEVVFYGDD